MEILLFILQVINQIIIYITISLFILPYYLLVMFLITGFFLYTKQYIKDNIYVIAKIWDYHGKIWHGYEIKGYENIPNDEPALLIYYHGTLPVDLYYLTSKIYLDKKKLINIVADRFLFSLPGWDYFSDNLKIITGSVDSCSEILQKNNNLLAIAPGGLFEAQFSDNTYKVLWKNRYGFAKVAIKSKVKIIPIFTENIREVFRCADMNFRDLFLKLYYWKKLPFIPIYGGFPVKLITHIGKPITYEENITPEELQLKVIEHIENLINKNQKCPGNILRAVSERFYYNA